jgi:RNA polymerase sigma factor (sigma-70 family)
MPAGAAVADFDRADESDLVRARQGDRAAFARLVGQHYDMIHRVARRWAGNATDAEDVAQEVCIKFARAISGFDGRSSLKSWLYRITLNTVRDVQRSGGRAQRGAAHLALVTAEVDEPAQEASVAQGEMWAAVRRLPAQQRDAILLVYAEELSHAEAGDILGCKPDTVAWHIHQAKKTLKGLL